jgi:hypothetical protein
VPDWTGAGACVSGVTVTLHHVVGSVVWQPVPWEIQPPFQRKRRALQCGSTVTGACYACYRHCLAPSTIYSFSDGDFS